MCEWALSRLCTGGYVFGIHGQCMEEVCLFVGWLLNVPATG